MVEKTATSGKKEYLNKGNHCLFLFRPSEAFTPIVCQEIKENFAPSALFIQPCDLEAGQIISTKIPKLTYKIGKITSTLNKKTY